MPATLYTDILKDASSKRFKYGDVELRDWFRDKALQVSSQNTSIERLVNKESSKTNAVTRPKVGKMLMYRYDPKHKLTLPYYDTFPMIFPIDVQNDRFLGINLHYLPPVYRARLMDALYDTLNNDRYDEKSKLQISYKILKSASKFRYFKPTIHMYLYAHVRSQLIEVDIKEWDYCLFLPLARFKKMGQRSVWDESLEKIAKSAR